MSKVVYRYRVLVDDIDFRVPAGRVVHVAADRGGKRDLVEVWVEHQQSAADGPASILLNVHGTGHPIPDDDERVHVGSCVVGLFVWHVYAQFDDGEAPLSGAFVDVQSAVEDLSIRKNDKE